MGHISYANIQGFTTNKDELLKLIEDTKPICVILSETHITTDIEDVELSIDGYNKEICYSRSRHTGGVSLYVSNQFKYKVLINEGDNINLNYWFLGIKISIGKQIFNIIGLYHSPNQSHQIFLKKLEEVISKLYIIGSIFIIVGDFNIDQSVELLPERSCYKNKLNECIKRFNLFQIVQEYTRVTKDSKSIVDLIVTNNKYLNYRVQLTPKISDHHRITINLEKVDKRNHITKLVRCFKSFNKDLFQQDLLKEKWNSTSCDDIDSIEQQFTGTILKVLDKHAPLKTIKVRSRQATPWWDEEINSLIKERDVLYKIFVENGRNVIDWNSYKAKRNEVVGLLRQKKVKFYNKQIDDNKSDSKEMWKYLKALIKGSNKNTIEKEVFFPKHGVESDADKICNLFNEYFIESVQQIIGIKRSRN